MSSLDSINSDSLPEKVGNLDTDELCSDLAVYTKIDEENARKRLSSSIVVTSPGGGEEEHHQQLLHVSTNNIKLSPLLNPNSASMRPISPSSALSPISALDGYSPFSSTGNGNPSGNTIVRTASPASATVDMADPIVKSPILSHAKISAGGGGNNSGTVSLSPVSAAVVLSPSHNNETSSQQQQHQHQKSDWSTGTRASSSPKSRDGLAQTQHDSSSGASPANSGDKILSARALVQAKDAVSGRYFFGGG